MNVPDLLEHLGDRSDCGEVINLLPKEFNRCIVGTTDDVTLSVCRVVYDKDLVIGELQLSSDMSYEDAVEYFEYNIAGAFVAPAPPVFIERVGV